MNRAHGLKTALAAAASCTLAVALVGCSSGSDSPTAPGSPVAGLSVEVESTAVQPEPAGTRIQIRGRVLEGLRQLSDAAGAGVALAELCLDGSCVEQRVSLIFSEGACAGLPTIEVDGVRLGIAAAWLDGDRFGVDFCVQGVARERTFETTMVAQLSRSNAIRTGCAPQGASIFCASD